MCGTPHSTAALGFWGSWVAAVWGPSWGEGSTAHLGAACQTELVFSVPSVKSLWIYSLPTAQQVAWPHTCLVLPHRPQPGSCVPSGATEPRPWGFPSNGAADAPGTLPLPPGPESTCSTISAHFRVRIPQNTPFPRAGDAGRAGSPCPAGSRSARERCPARAVSPAGPAPGRRAAWGACLPPSRAEPSRAEREEPTEPQCPSVRQAPIYGLAVWRPRGAQPCLPPPPLCKQEQGGAPKPKGRQGTSKCFPPVDTTCLLRGAKLLHSKLQVAASTAAIPALTVRRQGARARQLPCPCRTASFGVREGPGRGGGNIKCLPCPGPAMGLMGTFGCSSRTPSFALGQIPASPEEAPWLPHHPPACAPPPVHAGCKLGV